LLSIIINNINSDASYASCWWAYWFQAYIGPPVLII
jgi:hypothetical protein